MGVQLPSFETAKNRRQRARAAGMNPDYWYAVEHSGALEKGQVQQVTFWGRQFAIFRGSDGLVRALEDRCAHRQLPLSKGEVHGCRVTCPYHGWSYDHEGRLVDIPHELFGKKRPKISVAAYPVRERYGLIWLFPGDASKAEATPMPEIPEIEGDDAWACVPIDYTWQAHHSMIIENVCDFTHEFLHRDWKPFADPNLRNLDVEGDRIDLGYDTKVAAGGIYSLFADRSRSAGQHMKLGFYYPHQWSDTDGRYKHWMFVLPVNESTTRVFFLFYYADLKVPFLPLTIPRMAMKTVLKVANRLVMHPLLEQDRWAVEEEQKGYERHHDAPVAEFSPVVTAFQKLTIERWEAYLASRDERPRHGRLPLAPSD